MEINRRGFIARLIGGAVLMKVLPESLVGSEPIVTRTPGGSLDVTQFIEQLNATTLKSVYPAATRDFYFKSSAMLARLREGELTPWKGSDYHA